MNNENAEMLISIISLMEKYEYKVQNMQNDTNHRNEESLAHKIKCNTELTILSFYNKIIK